MINFNGELIDDATEVLTVQNRAFKYGDGLFETMKIENAVIHFLEDHYFRLMASMRMLRLEIPMNFNMEFFESEILKTVKANNLVNARVRCTVFRKDGGLYKPHTNEVDFIMEAVELKISIQDNYTIDLFKDYFVYSGLLSTIKTTNKLTNVLASVYASENQLDNCILLNEKKHVVEAINGNIFLVKGNVIKTPAISEGCIKGIIRKKLIEIISNHANLSIEEIEISPFELQKCDEIFITNAISGIQAVTSYRKKTFKTTVCNELKLALAALV